MVKVNHFRFLTFSISKNVAFTLDIIDFYINLFLGPEWVSRPLEYPSFRAIEFCIIHPRFLFFVRSILFFLLKFKKLQQQQFDLPLIVVHLG